MTGICLHETGTEIILYFTAAQPDSLQSSAINSRHFQKCQFTSLRCTLAYSRSILGMIHEDTAAHYTAERLAHITVSRLHRFSIIFNAFVEDLFSNLVALRTGLEDSVGKRGDIGASA